MLLTHPACKLDCMYAKESGYDKGALSCAPMCLYLQQEHKAFELVMQFHQPKELNLMYSKYADGSYMDGVVQLAFEVWLAARSVRKKEVT